MNQFYGQNAEDFLLRKIFLQNRGFFVEVGCIDGKVFSNTLFFEELGWKGICIEAHSDYIKLIEENRPGSQVVHCAVGEKDEEDVTFYANSRGSLSSLDKSTEERWKRDFGGYFTGFEEQKVKKRTLTAIFDQLSVSNIDFISIDIEGYEVQALRGLDLNRYKPTVILVESNSAQHKSQIEDLLLPYGYNLVFSNRENLFYSLDVKHKSILNHRNFRDIPVHRFAHPMDKNTDSSELISIVSRPEAPSLLVRAKRLAGRILRKCGLGFVKKAE